MDNWDATVIRQLTIQRHTEDIGWGLASQRQKEALGGPSAARSHGIARRVTRLVAIALLAGALALGLAAPAAANPLAIGVPPFLGDFCYGPRHGGPVLVFPRCLPRPLPVPPGQTAI